MGVYSKENITQPCPDFITNRYELALYSERVLLNFEIVQLAPQGVVFLLLRDRFIVWSHETFKLQELKQKLSEGSFLRKRGTEERKDENLHFPLFFWQVPKIKLIYLELKWQPAFKTFTKALEARKEMGEARKTFFLPRPHFKLVSQQEAR